MSKWKKNQFSFERFFFVLRTHTHSKHDIIELHGFDGPEDDGTQKSEDAPKSPPARSTPSKNANHGVKKLGKTDDHFNFDQFLNLKLDIPSASMNGPRDQGTTVGGIGGTSAGESRFSQWFGNDKAKQQQRQQQQQQQHAPKYPSSNAAYESAKSTPQQFFDYHQKANQKKMNAPNKFRSVDELEANWQPGKTNTNNNDGVKVNETNGTTHSAVDMAIRSVLAQLAQLQQRQPPATSAQSNFFTNLMNQNATTNSYQHRMTQSALMERPDAQLLLHRLVNGEITQFHILQQIGNPTLHQRDRETLLGVFKFCNENQQWLRQQQDQQLKHKQQMSQQFRLLQIIQMKNANMSSPLQAAATAATAATTAQAIMQNAMYKKQFEDLQRLKANPPPKFNKFQSYKGNHQSMPNQQNSRPNRGYY